MAENNPSPFSDLPGALVDEVLQRTADVGKHLLGSFEHVRKERKQLREDLQKRGLLSRDNELEYPPIPSCSAVDGSYAVERLLTTDLAAAAAVAVEGLTPPSEKRFWEQPRHQVVVEPEPYPLYLADRMVKSLARAIPTFRQAATQSIAEKYTGNFDEIFYGMHGYRTDSGG